MASGVTAPVQPLNGGLPARPTGPGEYSDFAGLLASREREVEDFSDMVVDAIVHGMFAGSCEFCPASGGGCIVCENGR